ncbi:MAG: hypothetical protein MSG64_13390 [Pyrinomonadaceae bacterium MAG19_C2-C3]|nr:hypothetical protein [Pyrinomonadaceae bacterium MAG19_C2-C3]
MLKLATDEDFNNRILRGVLRRSPDLDIRRKQDTGLGRADDPQVRQVKGVYYSRTTRAQWRVLLTSE